MRRLAVWTSLLALILAAGFATAAPAKATSANGDVVSVDTGANSLVVKISDNSGQVRDVTFNVGADAKILKGGHPVQLSEVKSGDKVALDYESADGKNSVMTIIVQPAN